MKQNHSGDVQVNVEIPIHDLEDVIICAAGSVIAVIGFYMATDSVRHILKTLIK